MRRLIICTFLLSLPAWGAWIEIGEARVYGEAWVVAPRMGTWIEMGASLCHTY